MSQKMVRVIVDEAPFHKSQDGMMQFGGKIVPAPGVPAYVEDQLKQKLQRSGHEAIGFRVMIHQVEDLAEGFQVQTKKGA